MDAALELFAAKGFDGTSTREIAQAAGVAEGLIFHHFDSKESLASYLLRYISFPGPVRRRLIAYLRASMLPCVNASLGKRPDRRLPGK